uniref:Uncharacterized protein n=1 Tax=Tetranychus urticae TaxID=32264 RepID=T1K1N1_TETUR
MTIKRKNSGKDSVKSCLNIFKQKSV